MSPPNWVRTQLDPWLRRQPIRPGRLYLDDGTHEGFCDAEPLFAILCEQGYRPGREMRYIKAFGAGHNERAWADRLPGALRFLLR